MKTFLTIIGLGLGLSFSQAQSYYNTNGSISTINQLDVRPLPATIQQITVSATNSFTLFFFDSVGKNIVTNAAFTAVGSAVVSYTSIYTNGIFVAPTNALGQLGTNYLLFTNVFNLLRSTNYTVAATNTLLPVIIAVTVPSGTTVFDGNWYFNQGVTISNSTVQTFGLTLKYR